jgi:hypothetical protein
MVVPVELSAMSARLPERRARGASKRSDDEFLSEAELSDDEFDDAHETVHKRAPKRKRVEVDLDAIEDPTERRIQKQRAKNRCVNAPTRGHDFTRFFT